MQRRGGGGAAFGGVEQQAFTSSASAARRKHRHTAWTIYTAVVIVLIVALLSYDTGFQRRLRAGSLVIVPITLGYVLAIGLFFWTTMCKPGSIAPDHGQRQHSQPLLSSVSGEDDGDINGDASPLLVGPTADDRSHHGEGFTTHQSRLTSASLSSESLASLKDAPTLGAPATAATSSEDGGSNNISTVSTVSSDSAPLMLAAHAGLVPPRQFCRVCQAFQPMRTKHCLDCRRCVRRFDHHCPFLGQCIGERNHRFFFVLLVVHSVVAVEVFLSLLVAWPSSDHDHHQHQQHDSKDGLWWLKHALLFGSLTITCLGLVGLFLLTGCHSYLACTGTTTWELFARRRITYLRHLHVSINPFDEGLFKNLRRFFFPPPEEKPTVWEHVYARRMRRVPANRMEVNNDAFLP